MYPIQLLQIMSKFDITNSHLIILILSSLRGMPLVILYTEGLFYPWSADAGKMPLKAILHYVGNLYHKK